MKLISLQSLMMLVAVGTSSITAKNTAMAAEAASTSTNENNNKDHQTLHPTKTAGLRGSKSPSKHHIENLAGVGHNNTIPFSSEEMERQLNVAGYSISASTDAYKQWMNLAYVVPDSSKATSIEFIPTKYNVNLPTSPSAFTEMVCPGIYCPSPGRPFTKRYDQTYGFISYSIPTGSYRVRLAYIPYQGPKTIYAVSSTSVSVSHCPREQCYSATQIHPGQRTPKQCRDCGCGWQWENGLKWCSTIGYF